MKIAVSANSVNLLEQVEPRLGRCKCFILYDTETRATQAIDYHAQYVGGGADIQAGEAVQKAGATVILTGSVNPDDLKVLRAGTLKVYPGVTGTIKDAIRDFLAGKYQPAETV
jgi:predicted Fe-Mo cluster-binding NifX family protein